MKLDGGTFLLQWATGGLFFLWVTGRRREVGIGYGWTVRGTFGLLAVGAVVAADSAPAPLAVRVSSSLVALAAGGAFWLSWRRRRAGVLHQREGHDRRSSRVAEMTGIEREGPRFDHRVAEFPPAVDLVAPLVGLTGLVAAGWQGGASPVLDLARLVAGAAFLGCVSDAMLLGHWYLVQPGLPRGPLLELVRCLGALWPAEVILLLVPTGMVSVFTGAIDDSYGGMLGWFWAACALTTLALVVVTRAALRERQYAAVMAATGLLYLAILTAFGTDLVARALLA